ncbi:uncharacterized protein LOC130998105 [Salvia miltiorrhiza]|uniref:uncharacterized protein LOC130998105 n=1 Tax=Salvia miltiorrhiza TaxID=226208 RepID=UPI0025ABFED0|nr:uncharacterized protein LOC130998105 [Salvia miltiorrhiza]
MVLEQDSENHVIGSNAKYFSSQLGIMAKDGNKLPLSYTDWRAVPNTQKDLIWDDVKENTNLTDNYKNNCLRKIGKLWKDWKGRLKAKYYTPHRHDKSYVLSKCPQRVEPDQWPILVNYWSSNNAKKLSKTNRNSRKLVKLPPRMGRKDMAGAKDEYRREHGKEPSKLDLFIYSRQRKSEKPVDKNTEEKIARLKELKQKLPEELVDDIEANDAIFQEVIGREAPGCLRNSNIVSSKNLIYTSREEFDRAVQERTNGEIESIRKGFEENISKFKEEYCSKMELLQARLLTLEDQNMNVSGSLNSRRIQAVNNGSSSEGFMNMEIFSEANETLEVVRSFLFIGTSDNYKEQQEEEKLPMIVVVTLPQLNFHYFIAR